MHYQQTINQKIKTKLCLYEKQNKICAHFQDFTFNELFYIWNIPPKFKIVIGHKQNNHKLINASLRWFKQLAKKKKKEPIIGPSQKEIRGVGRI